MSTPNSDELDACEVTVCDACLTAACLQGKFMCQLSQSAGIASKTVRELRELNRESEDYWREDIECSLATLERSRRSAEEGR